jgi:hypothetical protein
MQWVREVETIIPTADERLRGTSRGGQCPPMI